MTQIHTRRRWSIATLVGAVSVSLFLHVNTAAADEDDDFEISPVCRAKPWLPVCNPPESPTPPPQLPFPCDFLQSGCPWWYLN